jgi:hypothetical protein
MEAGRAGKPEERGVATNEPARWRVLRRAVALGAGLAVLGLVAGGCGGAAPQSVANLGTGTTPSSSGAGGGNSSSPQGGASPNDTAKFVAFADCMNKHGFPVSVSRSGNGVNISPSSGAGSGASPESPQSKAALHACQKLLPGGGPGGGTPAQQAQARQAELALATCMRQHGYPNFPDPTQQGVLNLSNMGNVDTNGPQFRAAMDSCQSKGGGAKGPIRIFQGPPGSTPP